MRVIAGTLGGRQFEAPATHRTHPMSERMRGGLFNALGDLSGLKVLDCFGGSGALSFEAISRGAAHSVIVEIDKTAHKTIEQNAHKLDIQENVKIIRANVSSWSDNNPELTFDIILCNPPFDGLKAELIQKLTKHLAEGGIFVLCWPTRTVTPDFEGLRLDQVKAKDYGDACLIFYRKAV